ncbi:hypothetical protein U9M48_004476 [Paspalum notatum var. saurae]|uniref:Uncharacterized protein n=1 Tax=Paspalum notatum var. saurae TaxID=547442 RepID=A0AAQ3SLB9_PASNO
MAIDWPRMMPKEATEDIKSSVRWIITANTIFSIFYVNYPVDKVYVSDDGSALLTFESLSDKLRRRCQSTVGLFQRGFHLHRFTK